MSNVVKLVSSAGTLTKNKLGCLRTASTIRKVSNLFIRLPE